MNVKKFVLSTVGIGAGLMYFLDPSSGRRRRALIRDQIVRGTHGAKDALDVTSRDMENRIRGLAAEVRRLFGGRKEVDQSVLVERVRAALGGVVSHPGSIEVEALDDRIILKGVVLADELRPLIRRVRSVPGVKTIENRVEPHEEPGKVPGLQGKPSGRFGRSRFEFMQTNWSPAARFVAGLAGGAMALYGLRSRGLARKAVLMSGGALVARALTNMEIKRMIGMGKRGIDIRKSIRVNAPVEDVFKALSHFEDFPNFMKHVKKVSKTDGDRYRWTVFGPGQIPVEWESVLTSNVPNEELAWSTSENGGVIEHAGSMKFIPNSDGSTNVEIRLTYHPIGGGVGHAIASLVGADPKSKLDEDLVRMKTYIETGKEPRDAAAARH